jgi:hypothetical protein
MKENQNTVQPCEALGIAIQVTFAFAPASIKASVETSVKTSVKTPRAIELAASKLVKAGRLKYVGPKKGGHWNVMESIL